MSKVKYHDWNVSQDNRIHLIDGLAPALGSSSGQSKPKIKVIQKRGGYGSSVLNDETGTLQGGGDNVTDKVPNVLLKGNIRRLTETECERLQGYPDNWTKFGNYDGDVKEISRTQRYKLCGNAVTVDVVDMIGRKLVGLEL